MFHSMLSFRKVADRVSDNSSDNKYLDRMGLTHSRIWIRYRGRAIRGVKANCKRSWANNLECRFCTENIRENTNIWPNAAIVALCIVICTRKA